MKRSNCATGWWFLASVLMVLSAACSGGGSGGSGGQSGLGGSNGKGGAGANVDSGAGGSDPTDGSSTDVPQKGTTDIKLVVGPPSLTLTEGSSMTGTISVALDRPNSQAITVSIVSANSNIATAIPETVTFPENTPSAQIVNVVAPIDDDTVPNSTTLTVFSQETGSATVTVNVDDPDVQGLLASPASLSMTEGRTESVAIRLSKKPASAVVVTLTSSAETKLVLGTTSLTFTAANYSVPQSVSLMAQQDDDAMAEHVSVKATATGNIKDLVVPVEIIDDDAVNLDVSPSSVSLFEPDGPPGTFKVSLTRAPATDLTVSVVSANVNKVTVTPANLAFTVTNFATPQTVTVAAVHDDDGADENVAVTLSSPNIVSRDVTVGVDDRDSQALKVVPASVAVGEGGSATFTVALALKPSGDSAVNIFSQNPNKVNVSPPILHFDGTNFMVPQTVTLQAAEDDDLVADNVNVTLIGSGATSVTVPVAISDNDTQSLILIPAGGGSSLVLQETRAGAAKSTSPVGVRLAYRPSDVVTIAFVSSNPAKLSFSPASVTFVPSDFATPKTVTLTAEHDADMLDDKVDFTAQSSGLPDAKLAVQILDVDVQNLDLSGNPATLNVSEHSLPTPVVTMAPLTVKLNVQPQATVTVNFTSSDTSKVPSPAPCTIAGGPTSTAYLTGCTVQVKPASDDDGRDESATITISAMVDGVPFSRSIPVAVDDMDIQALVVSTSDLQPKIMEGGTGTFTVGLQLNPVVPVTISLYSNDPTHFSVPSTLTFTSALPQTVTVTSLNDDDMANYDSTITIDGSGAGITAGPGVTVTKTVGVHELNGDKQGIVMTPSPLAILERTSAQIGVRLAYRPTGTETVSLTSMDTSRLTLGATSLTFDGTDYAGNKYVTVTSLPDNDMALNSVTVAAGAMPSGATVNETVNITDTDVLNLVVNPVMPSAAIGEESSTTTSFTVGLTVTPTNPVVVTVMSGNTQAVTAANAASGTCSLSSISQLCTFNLAAVADANAASETVTITVMGSGLTSQTFNVTTVDNDTQAIKILSPAPAMTIHESTVQMGVTVPGSDRTTFSITLGAQPAASTDITVSVQPSAADGISVYFTDPLAMPPAGPPASLPATAATTATVNFKPSEWTSTSPTGPTKTVTIVGFKDSDLRSDPFSIQISPPAGLNIGTQFLSITEVDDDTQQIILYSASSDTCGAVIPNATTVLGSLAEMIGAELQFCVSLAYQPLSNTVVDTAIATDTSIISPSSVSLQFTTSMTNSMGTGWSDKHLVTITSDVDDNVVNGNGTINLTSSGFAATRNLTFTTTDGESQQLVFFPTGPISIASSGMTTVTIKPTKNPISPITVICTSDNSALTLSSTMFTFTGGHNGSWMTAKPFTLNVAASTALVDVNVACTIMDLVPAVSQTLIVHAGN